MKLHEILAIEKSAMGQMNVLLQDTLGKFGKQHFFQGMIKNLKLLKDSPDNSAIEAAGSESKEVITTVKETLNYLARFWTQSEDIQFQKNVANQIAVGTISLEGFEAKDIPIDELMGLEARLTKLREVFHAIPTLDATKVWQSSSVREGVYMSSTPDITTKTEKIISPLILHESTKEHPAQVREVSKDEVIGTFTTHHFSGAITSLKKAEMLERIDVLLAEIKKARMRANSCEVKESKIGQSIMDYLLKDL